MAGAITFYHPGKRFPAFSVTGGRCELQCDHCRGKYLQGMRALNDPEELIEAASSLAADGGEGFLLSGGCDARGRVPLSPYLGAVRTIKRTTYLLVNLHTGLLDEETASALKGSGADAFSVDVLQDRRTMRDVLHLSASPSDYARTLELLSTSGRLVPHICVGLQSEEGEKASLELVSSMRIEALIVLGLVPARGTPWDGRPVAADRLLGFIEAAVDAVNAPVLLGCMRPRGDWTVEAKAIEAGIAGLVNPSPRTAEWAAGKGLKIERKERCCAFHL